MVHAIDPDIYMCHNDPHGHNMMIGVNEDGSPNVDTYQMIDFDNGEFGFRAWDFEYYFSYFNVLPSDELIDDMIEAYLEVFNAGSEKQFTVSDIRRELEYHRPYVMMEQMLFRRFAKL